MDAIGVALLGVGAYLMYSAYANEHPWQRFQTILTGSSTAKVSAPAAMPEAPSPGSPLTTSGVDPLLLPPFGN